MTCFYRYILLVLVVFTGIQSFGMDFTQRKLRVWKRGETLGGEEFLSANEEVMDYIAKLDRPSENFKSLAYNCELKSQEINPTVQTMGTTPQNTTYVRVQMVYAIKNCVPAN